MLRTDLDAPFANRPAKVRISAGLALETGKLAYHRDVVILIVTQLIIETQFCKAVGLLRLGSVKMYLKEELALIVNKLSLSTFRTVSM